MGMGIAASKKKVPARVARAMAAKVAEALGQQVIKVLAGFTPGPGWVQQLVETTARFVFRLVFRRATAAMA